MGAAEVAGRQLLVGAIAVVSSLSLGMAGRAVTGLPKGAGVRSGSWGT